MKMNYTIIATGPWADGVQRTLIIPADSAEEACDIARDVYGATSAVSMGGRSVYLGPGGSTGGKTIRPDGDEN